MTVRDVIENRLAELVAHWPRIEAVRRESPRGGGASVDGGVSRPWALSVRTTLESAFGRDSALVAQVDKSLQGSLDVFYTCQCIYGAAQAGLSDWRAGFPFRLEDKALDECEGELLEQAEALLGLGYARSAAVLVGATLEAHVRRLAERHGVEIVKNDGGHRSVENIRNDLQSKGAIGKTVNKHLGVVFGLRNDAAHGGDFNHSVQVVESTMRDVVSLIARLPLPA